MAENVIDTLLRTMVQNRASDLHIRANGPPVMRVDGKLLAAEQILSKEETLNIAYQMMNNRQRLIFDEKHECDMSYTLDGVGRFRCNAFLQKGGANIAIRVVPTSIPDFDTLKLPPSVKKIAENQRGLVLVTGTTGSGKSTTLASMVDHINKTRYAHIITIEDPIEFIHRDQLSIISQRELGMDTLTYTDALKHVVRQDPDVILLGEMRDLETMSAALTAAQTGHLVLSTIHTIDAIQTVTRVVDMFPPYQQNQIRLQLADTLRGVISQRLLPHVSGQGRVPAVEVLVVTALVKKLIGDSNSSELMTAIKQGQFYGMQTFNQSLVKLVNEKMVTLESALEAASNPEELMLSVRGIETGTDSGTMFGR